jgi:hypothetical protein
MHYPKEKKTSVTKEDIFYWFILILLFALIICYASLENYAYKVTIRDKIINKKNQEVKEKDIEIDHLKHPPEIYNPIEIAACEDGYMEGIYILTDNINKFLFWNHFHQLTVMCSNMNQHVIKKEKQNLQMESIYLNSDLSYWNGTNIVSINKKELLCHQDEHPIGIMYTHRDHELKVLCKKISNIKKHYMSPIYANTRSNIDGERSYHNCGENAISDVDFQTDENTKYLKHIDLACSKEKKDFALGSVSINFGDFIDSVSYFTNEIELPCDDCSKGGVHHKFECPNNMKITGHYEWHRNRRLVGIQFMCFFV